MVTAQASEISFRTDPCTECWGEGCEACDGTGNWFKPKHYQAWFDEAKGAALANGFALIDPRALLKLLNIAESVYPCGRQYPIRGKEATISETETTYDLDGNIELSVEERDPKELATRYGEFFEQLCAYDTLSVEQAFELTRELLRAEQALPAWNLAGQALEIPNEQ